MRQCRMQNDSDSSTSLPIPTQLLTTRMIDVRDLKPKKFPGVLAVDRISFTTSQRRDFGLLGPNGAGKTTTLRMILSILKPTSGDILVDGISVCARPAGPAAPRSAACSKTTASTTA